jgi:hypothetical protein
MLPECRFIVTRLPLMIGGALALNLAVALIAGLAFKIIVACAVFLFAVPALWLWMFTPAERAPLQVVMQRWNV